MKKRSIPLGEILTDLGRITPEDIERALAYQREHGGFFGDALVALGLLSEEEVRFALADQYDLPVVHLRPDNIDRGVARTVPREWAREHQMLPVLRDGDTVTVIATAPPSVDEIEAIQRMTRAGRVEVAVSSPETIATLVDSVHRLESVEESSATVIEWLSEAIGAGARMLGVSVRGDETFAWYRADPAPVRMGISGTWREELDPLVSTLDEERGGGLRSWPAVLTLGVRAWRVDCSAVASGDAAELVFRLDTEIPGTHAGASRELCAAVVPGTARSKTLRVGVTGGGSAGMLEVLLPTLPNALLDGTARSLHLSDRPIAVAPGVLALRFGSSLAETFASLEPLGLDALTLDVGRLDPDDLELACRVAPLVAFRDLPSLSKRLHPDLDVCLQATQPLRWNLIS